jgi:hypothetical protein
MHGNSRGIVVGGHDGCFLIIDKAGVDYVLGVRSPTGEVLTVYLMDADVRRIVEFCSHKPDYDKVEPS